MSIEFRDLTAEEIEVRVSTINDRGLTLLLYKDSRVDQRILDETVGPAHWQKRFYECKGTLFCSVGIWCGDEWVWKDDAGAPSNQEAEKGEASDAFKRACFNWGLGRELYTAPFIWIPAGEYQSSERNGRKTTYDQFRVAKIRIEDKRITGLAIENATLRKIVYTFVLDKKGGE